MLSIDLYGFTPPIFVYPHLVHFQANNIKTPYYMNSISEDKENGNKEYYYIAFISNQIKKVGAASSKL
jgi:hypothetical protein